MRDGYVAHWQGADYEAAPAEDGVHLYATEPAEGFTEVGSGRYVRVVAEVERLVYVRTRGVWQDEPVIVIGEHEDWLRVEYTGGRGPVAAALGLEKIDAGVWQAWAPRDEVHELHEEAI